MSDRKKRLLFVGEFSGLRSGFSKISEEVMTRLYKTGKYELFELGNYAKTSDPRALQFPWKIYGSMPEDQDFSYQNRYGSDPEAQFGKLIFDQVLLDCKPDCVVSFTDAWMSQYKMNSPFRRLFKWIYMHPTDSGPPKPEWIDLFKNVDYLLAYAEYGRKTMIDAFPSLSKKDIKVVRPGVNHEVFKPLDKKHIRTKLGIPENARVVLSVMRNQRRKLWPNLMDAFSDYIKYCIKNDDLELAKNSYLHVHTSYPDVGFDIPKHIIQNGIGHKVLCTYVCDRCKNYFVDFFQTEITACKFCGTIAAHMPNTGSGVSEEQLCEIYNAADLYVQFSIAGALEMPICEAKACEVPCMATDYAAMSEQVNIYGGFPIKVDKLYYESVIETEQIRALPSEEDLVKKMFKFFKLTNQDRKMMGVSCRKDVVDNYSFDRAAKIFEDLIDQIQVKDTNETWDNANLNIMDEVPKFDGNISNSELVDSCIRYIVKRPELMNTHYRNELVRSLNIGYINGRGGRQRFDRNNAVQMFVDIAKNNNFWENTRVQPLISQSENFRYETV